jgi:hypothetical protein
LKNRKIIKSTVLLVSIAYIFRFFYKNWGTIEIGFSFDKTIIFSIIVLTLSTFITYAYRFKIILAKCSGTSLPFWAWFRIVILGRFLNLIFAQMGNVYRGVELKKIHKITYTDYISSFVSFAWMDMCLNLAIAELVILLYNPGMKIYNQNIASIILLMLLVIFLSPIFAKITLQNLFFKQYKWSLRLSSKLEEVLTVTLDNLKDIRYLIQFTILGLAVLVQTLAAYFLLFLIFEIKLYFTALIIFYTLLRFSAFVVITPGNMGIQEIAFGFLGEQMGIGMAQGMVISFTGRFINTLIIISLGIFFGGIDLLRHKKNIQKPESSNY